MRSDPDMSADARPINATIVGAGSMFTQVLVADLLNLAGGNGGRLNLVDIDAARLQTMGELVQRTVDTICGDADWEVCRYTDRREALSGSDFIIVTIEVNGLDCVGFDNDIPASYGVDQCIGDTIGPGGVFKGLRTIPVFLDILKDAEAMCPNALVLNYTNPMSMLCLAASQVSPMSVVGLCHSVQATSKLLAKRAQVPYDEMHWECAGINHLAWFTRLRHNGQDLYPDLMQMAKNDLNDCPANIDDAGDLVRKDMMVNFGAFITESSGHLSEYLPYYRSDDTALRTYCGPGHDGESRFYANHWPGRRKEHDARRQKMLSGDEPINQEMSHEYASHIIDAVTNRGEFSFHGNVANHDGSGSTLIGNLQKEGIVEVECIASHLGIQPTKFGVLPAQMAAICRSNMSVYELAVEAAINSNKEAAIHALMLDPLCAATCTPSQIREMTLDLFEAEANFLPGFD